MADEPQSNSHSVLRAINWREVFPFTHIFRAFRVAVHPSKLVLGLLALLMLYVGGRVLDWVWPQKHEANYGEVVAYAEHNTGTFSNAIAGRRLANQRAYASLLQALDLRDQELDKLNKALDEQKKTAGSDAKKLADAEKDFDERQRDLLESFNSGAAAMAAGRIEPRGVSAELQTVANDFPRVRESKIRLNAGRDLLLANAKRGYDRDLNDANAISDATKKDENRRKAEERFAASKAAAFASVNGQLETVDKIVPRGLFEEFFDYQVTRVNNIAHAALNLSWSGIVSNTHAFFITGPSWLFKHHWLFATLFFVMFLLVWAVFGGAIARIAAVHVARDEKISVRQALRFSINKVLSFVFAPVIPLIIVLVIGLLLAVGGLLYYVPFVGPIVAGGLFFLALIAGVVITLVLFGTIGGLNLMFPTVAVEGSDSFDAISRSFSYVFARPWKMVFYTLVAVVYGGLTYLFVRFFAYLVLSTARFFVGWFLAGQPGTWYPEMMPESSLHKLPYDVNFSGLAWSEGIGAWLISFWAYLLIGLVGAFAISFYFSVNTIIYYLMRREVDATEMEEVYVEEDDDGLMDTVPVSPSPTGPTVPTGGSPASPIPATAGALPSSSTVPATIVGTTADLTPPADKPPLNI